MVEMDMHARENLPMIVMLNVGQLSRQIAHMMVVDEGDRADRLPVPLYPSFLGL